MTRQLHWCTLNRILISAAVVISAAIAAAQTRFDVYRFPKGGQRGFAPSGLVADKQGTLYGTTEFGGTGGCSDNIVVIGCGTVFRLTPPATLGGSWTETVLHNFQGRGSQDGYFPLGGLIFDEAGNLYGTTQAGGGQYCSGAVFKLSPPAGPRAAWTESSLHCFTADNRDRWQSTPAGNLTFDGQGNLYGTTGIGQFGPWCDFICGSVFQVLHPTSPGGTWTENMLATNIGASFDGGLIFDVRGNLYGTAFVGGQVGTCTQYGCGLVFELSPGNPWVANIVYEFSGGSDGMEPNPGLIFDHGNFYGTTGWGGAGTCGWSLSINFGCGTVFELSPSANGGWTETVLYRFQGDADGSVPSAALVADEEGNLYGTTSTGGKGSCAYLSQTGCGTAFKLTRPREGEAWTKTTVFEFTGGDGFVPVDQLLFSNGALYGTTASGGATCPQSAFGGGPWPPRCGTVFKIIP
jgi:hypothetical protein